MIRHIVLVNFKPEIDAARKRELFDALGDLRNTIGGIVDYRCGPNVSPEAPVIHGFEDGFWFDFTDATARDAYLNNPDHKAVGAQLVEAVAGGLAGILVFDIELAD